MHVENYTNNQLTFVVMEFRSSTHRCRRRCLNAMLPSTMKVISKLPLEKCAVLLVHNSLTKMRYLSSSKREYEHTHSPNILPFIH